MELGQAVFSLREKHREYSESGIRAIREALWMRGKSDTENTGCNSPN
jgi:hypothetical protein